MSKTLNQLKILWNKEKYSYMTQELGSGVQKFVKEILKSEDLLNLSEGRLSTDDLKRKYEFLEEKTNKRKRADVIIFINSDIVIPMEIEKYGNIKAGVDQLYNYQRVWDKKYGLLTDGYDWLFYNNKLIVKRYNLDNILNNPEEFIEFWNEYIKPVNYYLQFFEKSGQLSFLEEDISVENKLQNFFFDITTLIKSFKNKLNIKGYFEKWDDSYGDKLATEITYAYIIQFILYKTLVDNDFEHFKEDFTTRLDRIHKDIKNEAYSDILTAIKKISELISINIYRPFKYEQEFINQTLDKLLLKPMNELSDITPWLDIFVFIKRYNFSNVKNEIFGYIYENYLKVLFEENKKGQYYTDPSVVNFMLEQIGYTSSIIKQKYETDNDTISIIDPSCGSGTFLYSAVNQIIELTKDYPNGQLKHAEDIVVNNIFGLDIAEFPLYLAEMSILMRMLPLIYHKSFNNPVDNKIKIFLTHDSISEFLDTKITTDVYTKYGQIAMNFDFIDLNYKSYVREENDLEEMKASLSKTKFPRRRFDYVIGNPPYVSYNDCSKQKVMIVELIKQKIVRMNDIYGMNLNTVPGRKKPYSPKPNLYAFFIALGIALLKDNGKMCYIIPQTVLTASDLDVVRYHLAKFTTLEKLVIFNGNMFLDRGLEQNKSIATSSLIFLLNKKKPSRNHMVEIINYKRTNDTIKQTLDNILLGKHILKQSIPQSKLLKKINNWNFIKHSSNFIDFYEEYEKNSYDIATFRSKLSTKDDLTFDGGVLIDNNKISPKDDGDSYEIFDYKENDWNLFGVSKSTQYYSKKSAIEYINGSQGILAFQKKYKIIWRTRFTERFQFTSRDILLVNNQSMIVSSNSKKLILFFFAILNSPITFLILEKQLKQENEKNYLVPLKAIKSLVRIPYINNNNTFIYDKIIESCNDLLTWETVILSDLIDFSNITVQKFDSFKCINNTLILYYDKFKTIEIKIPQNADIVEESLVNNFITNDYNLLEGKISLYDLKNLPIINFKKQKILKQYIDNLVFALYFKIPIEEKNICSPDYIHDICSFNSYYQLFNSLI